jgi:group I intron endonuclease
MPESIVPDQRPVYYTYPFTKRMTPQSAGVYKITCLGNGRFYIGGTTSMYLRWILHSRHLIKQVHCNFHLQACWKKYGQDSLVFEVVEFCDRLDLTVREQFYIDTLKPSLNIALYADRPHLGRKASEETRRRLSVSHMGQRPTNLDQLAMLHRERCKDPAYRSHLSSLLKGRPRSPEDIARITKRNKEREYSPEHRSRLKNFIIARQARRIAENGGTSKYPLLNDANWLRSQYHEHLKDMVEIARDIGINGDHGAAQVLMALRFHSIPTRNRSEAKRLYYAKRLSVVQPSLFPS